MRRLDGGIWETEVAGLSEYDTYKFAVTAQSGAVTFKADPYAFHAETRPGTASKLYELAGYDWGDGAYLAAKQPVYDRPLNIYEVHLGSWRRRENGDFYDYRSLADELSEYAAGPRLQLRGAAARDRASARRLVGLPVHRVLRPDLPVRHAARTSCGS